MLFVFLHHPCFCFTSGVGKVICVAVFLLGCQTALLVDMLSGCDPTSALYKKTNYGHMTNGAKGLRVSLKRLLISTFDHCSKTMESLSALPKAILAHYR